MLRGCTRSRKGILDERCFSESDVIVSQGGLIYGRSRGTNSVLARQNSVDTGVPMTDSDYFHLLNLRFSRLTRGPKQ